MFRPREGDKTMNVGCLCIDPRCDDEISSTGSRNKEEEEVSALRIVFRFLNTLTDITYPLFFPTSIYTSFYPEL